MSKGLRKMTDYLGLTEPDEAPVVEAARPALRTVTSPSPSVQPQRSTAPVVAQPSQPLPGMMQSANLDRIITLHQRFYNEARTVGEHFRQGNPVIINLSDMDDSERKRIIDFASGLVFGHSGSIERVTSKVFLLSPPNVTVSAEDKSAAAAASADFFNQS
ncbi:MAG: cell division protein SepF [Candidatus Nanopelagicaceae bacterium]